MDSYTPPYTISEKILDLMEYDVPYTSNDIMEYLGLLFPNGLKLQTNPLWEV